MSIAITAFERAFDEGRGLARDMRVRWALEEVGQPYEVRLVPWEKFKEEAHLARNPFGQIPTYEEGNLVLFESGAIVLHIAQRFPGLLPKDEDARARAIMWIFAALSTVEPPIVDRDVVEYFEKGKSWQAERFAMVDERIRGRLSQLVAHFKTPPPPGAGVGGGGVQDMAQTSPPALYSERPSSLPSSQGRRDADLAPLADAQREWLDGAFSAADIIMVHVLRRLEGSGLLEEFPTLAAYLARAEARPAYKRAFAAQLAVWENRAER